MSTRCHIIVKENNKETFIYHHHNGYPSGVGAKLESLLAECEHISDFNNLVDRITFIDRGYEVDDGIHGDEEFLYTITLDENLCTLKCEEYPEKLFVFEEVYKVNKYNKEDIMKIYKIFEEAGLIKGDLCFDPEHFIETVVIEKLKQNG